MEEGTANVVLQQVRYSTRAGTSVTFAVEAGDALRSSGDVLLLKYAQANYGLDRLVLNALGEVDPSVFDRLPPPGGSIAEPAHGTLNFANVVFVGTPPLHRFGHDALRAWARDGLTAAANVLGAATDRGSTAGGVVVATAHGLRMSSSANLEPGHALESIAQGVIDALDVEVVATRVAEVRIVEIDRVHARQMAAALGSTQVFGGAPVPTLPPLTSTVASARAELSSGGRVTAGVLAASIRNRHPEYAAGALQSITFDSDAGALATVDEWLDRVQHLYSDERYSSSGRRLSGRYVVAGLAMLEPSLRQSLEVGGALDALFAEMGERPRDPFLRHNVAWSPDVPVRRLDDQLGRRLVARTLADHLHAFDDEHGGHSFVALIDGRWGAGKSTLLQFLVEEFNGESIGLRSSPAPRAGRHGRACVVKFDAWRQSRAGPAWLRLMTAMRSQLVTDHHLGLVGRLAERWRRLSAATVAALAMLSALSAAIVGLWVAGVVSVDSLASQVPVGITFGTTVITSAVALGTMFAAESERRARSFVVSAAEPMEQLSEHFQWLRAQSRDPILLLIDDLDRCEPSYVVELLDTVQKLVRDEEPPLRERPTLFVIVAADGRWLRAAYEEAHRSVADAIGEPGRPLGSLFLDKFFQVRIPVPELSPRLQQGFLERLLGSNESALLVSGSAVQDTNARIEAATTHDEVLEALRAISPLERIRFADTALQKLNSDDSTRRSEAHHALEHFAPLLEPNPRSVRRFLMAFSVLRAARLAEGNPVASEPLALWTIVTVRWPLLAEFLTDDPDAVALFRVPEEQLVGLAPTQLRSLLSSPTAELREVFNHEVGGPLSADVIRQCAGIA